MEKFASLEGLFDELLKVDIKVDDGVFFACYLQSFILSFHGWRQAISCLLNLMGATFAQVGSRDTTNTSRFESLLTRSNFTTNDLHCIALH